MGKDASTEELRQSKRLAWFETYRTDYEYDPNTNLATYTVDTDKLGEFKTRSELTDHMHGLLDCIRNHAIEEGGFGNCKIVLEGRFQDKLRESLDQEIDEIQEGRSEFYNRTGVMATDHGTLANFEMHDLDGQEGAPLKYKTWIAATVFGSIGYWFGSKVGADWGEVIDNVHYLVSPLSGAIRLLVPGVTTAFGVVGSLFFGKKIVKKSLQNTLDEKFTYFKDFGDYKKIKSVLVSETETSD